MDNQIFKLVFDDMGAEAVSFIKVNDANIKVVTYHLANDCALIFGPMSGVESQSVLDSYVMKNNDDNSIIELINQAKERAVSYEEISEKAFDYSVKELCDKQLEFLLS